MIKKDSWLGDFLNALTLQSVYRKPKAVEDENFYGGDKTIHDTGHVDVVLDEDGNVSAVWFRCALLPFKQSERRVPVSEVSQYVNDSIRPLKGIVFEEDE